MAENFPETACQHFPLRQSGSPAIRTGCMRHHPIDHFDPVEKLRGPTGTGSTANRSTGDPGSHCECVGSIHLGKQESGRRIRRDPQGDAPRHHGGGSKTGDPPAQEKATRRCRAQEGLHQEVHSPDRHRLQDILELSDKQRTEQNPNWPMFSKKPEDVRETE